MGKAPAWQQSMTMSMATAVKMAGKLKSKAKHAKVRIQKFRDDLGVKDAFATRCWRRAHMNGHHHRLRKIATEKGYEGQIRGNADILIMPGIDSGNVVYKTLTVSSGLNAAGAIIGCGIPVVLASRGDSALTKLSSLALSLRLHFQRLQEEQETSSST